MRSLLQIDSRLFNSNHLISKITAMTKRFLLPLLFLLLFACSKSDSTTEKLVEYSDIERFWTAYDSIQTISDSTQQISLIEKLYIEPGTAGLHALMEARNYTSAEFVEAILTYPKFWTSVRDNTLKAPTFENDLIKGIQNLRDLYPELKPAKIYFTVGALRTNGTTLDSLVLIGSELALTDENTDPSEFPESYRAARRTFFKSNPIDDVVLLNVHEYVHTQQQPIVQNLLSQCLYEGVAEFVSTKAMNVPSAAPAIEFGKANEQEVRAKFERDLFFTNKTYEWLWGDANNGFGVRDLGYYVGYEICERYYESQDDKLAAIKTLIELDYTNQEAIQAFVDQTGYFDQSIREQFLTFERQRPVVMSVEGLENNSRKVDPTTRQITLHFSEKMDKRTRGFDYGPLGEAAILSVQNIIGFSEDGRSFTYEIALEPDRPYQVEISDRFRSIKGYPLRPYLIDIHTD